MYSDKDTTAFAPDLPSEVRGRRLEAGEVNAPDLCSRDAMQTESIVEG
jgi:hypothetical protein